MNTTNEARVAIVVLNHDKRDDLLECLASVAALDHASHRVIVVDNGSSDESADAVEASHPGFLVVRNASNVGAPSGRNLAMDHVRAIAGVEFVLFLDNDTVVDRGFLRELEAAADADPEAGIFCGKGYVAPPSHTLNSVGMQVNLHTARIRDIGLGEEDRGQYERSRLVDACAAFGCLVRLELLEALNGFDERYDPYGWEDVDLCLRATRLGRPTRYVPTAIVHHKGCKIGRGTIASYEASKVKNFFLLIRTHSTPMQRLSQLVCVPARAVGVALRMLRHGDLRALTAQFQGLVAGARPAPARSHPAMRNGSDVD